MSSHVLMTSLALCFLLHTAALAAPSGGFVPQMQVTHWRLVQQQGVVRQVLAKLLMLNNKEEGSSCQSADPIKEIMCLLESVHSNWQLFRSIIHKDLTKAHAME